MYDMPIRYIATLFVDANSIMVSNRDIIKLLERIDDENLYPFVTPDATNPGKAKLAFRSLDNAVMLKVGEERFEFTKQRRRQDHNNIGNGDFKDFLQEASIKLAILLDHFQRQAYRIAAVQDGLLPEMDESNMNCLMRFLMRLPNSFQNPEPFEWRWQCVNSTTRRFGSHEETINNMVSIWRVSGSIRTDKEADIPFDRIKVELEVNTSVQDSTPRFDTQAIKDYFEQAVLWHDELRAEISAFILEGRGKG